MVSRSFLNFLLKKASACHHGKLSSFLANFAVKFVPLPGVGQMLDTPSLSLQQEYVTFQRACKSNGCLQKHGFHAWVEVAYATRSY